MANGDFTGLSRSGLIQGGSDNDALFLKVFSGEILTSFAETNVMKELHMIRTISSGKSAQFPVSGIATAKYHTVGENIVESSTGYLSSIGMNEKIITIDDVLVSSTFIANIDELKQHYDVRSIYAAELGKALAKRFDIATMKTLYAASQDSANLTNTPAGTSITGATTNTASGIIDALYAVAETLDSNDAPDEGRFAILAPATYYKLLTSDNVAINKDTGSGGNVNAGTVASVAGIRLVKSNHLVDIAELGDDSAVATGDGSSNNDVFGSNGTGYNGDFSALTTGSGSTLEYGILAGTKEAIGTVKLLDLATESEYQIERQGTLFVAKYAMGHGVLRPECAVAVKPA
ncbi:MAG: putative minor capsid protein 10B [Prokaryotic dsDNA virus sp.]|jgi:hypothetical protein|nr:MAG: putative minor capsid protein 10B [Prokaryotic dsDNA virus sp.]|tara:strand:+ start:3159 stop:4199 length:1041 start_codon:yes stop_codon:yes gene_type:complete